VAGFVDFSAMAGTTGPFGLGDFVGGFAWFFDIVDGRKRSAGGGVLRFGCFRHWLSGWCWGAFGRRNAGCVLREPRFRRKPDAAATRQYSDRPVADRFRLIGHWEVKAQCFKLESLILAQNERWRQA
jgi:hypothetical protein